MAPLLRLLFYSTLLVSLSYQYSFAQSDIDKKLGDYEAKRIIDEGQPTSSFVLVTLNSKISISHLKSIGIYPVKILDDNNIIIKSSEAEKIDYNAKYSINNHWKLSNNINYNSLNTNELLIKTISDLEDPNFIRVGDGIYKINTHYFDIGHLLSNENVIYIGKESTTPKVESRVLDMNLNPNKVNLIHNRYPELNGNGITVSVKEQLFDKEDIDLIGRSVDSGLESTELNNHATEMATIIAGAGNTYITGRGVASEATITSSDFIEITPDNNSNYQDLDITIQNHSYGTEIENFYGVLAEAYDQSSLDNPTLIHVFSSGNAGQSVATEGTYANVSGYANLTGNFKHSKNTLSVGSVDTVNVHPVFVSSGPAYDGRIKPEVVAYSAVGASNSAAITSGIIALMQEAYFNQFAQKPESALIKAILINEAEDVGAVGPDFKTGFGNIDAFKSVEAIRNEQFIKGSVSNGITTLHNLIVPSGAKNLKITLTWMDDVGVVNSSKALINDLDLVVSDGINSFLPWVLNTNANNLKDQATRGVDRINNIEQVTINSPMAGNYDITVTGFDVSSSSIDYYIAYSWEMADVFEWTYPTSTDNMPYNGESRSYFRWNTTYSGTGILEYSLDNGSSWQVISSDIDLSDEYFTWLPTNISGIAKARMSIGGLTFESEDFTITNKLNFEMKFNCGDSIMIAWGRDINAIGYNIYSFSNQNGFKFLSNISDTSKILYKSDLASNYLKVKPVYSATFEAIGSEAFDYELIGSSCYLTTFSGEAFDDIIELRLNLALDYGVDNITFDRIDESGNTLINTITSVGLNNITEDVNPIDGINYYRGKINFSNGASILTDTISVIYLKNLKVYVYPNPLSSEDFLTVQLKDFNTSGVEFQLINGNGQLIYSQQLFGESNEVILPDVGSGVYLYRIITPEGIISDRVVILRE